ncbi:MAG: hypothetical protein HUJ97_08560 [Bacteroidales bacterium]|nr:hypothetical protein [Bacteroidales bacterium]
MNLRSFHIGASCSFQDKNFWDIFCYNTCFIGNWMTRKVRPLKMPTDGTFSQINVILSPGEDRCYTDVFKILQVEIHWGQSDVTNYLRLKSENDRLKLYLDLFRKGLIRAAQFKDIDLDVLIGLVEEFEARGCRNEWLFKSKTIRERNIKIDFVRSFTSYAFELKLHLYDLKKNLIAEKTVFKIYPDDIFVQGLFHRIVQQGDNLFIDDTLDRHVFSFCLEDLQQGFIQETLLLEYKKQYIYDPDCEKYQRIEWRYKQV